MGSIKGVTDGTTLSKYKPSRPCIGVFNKGGPKGSSKRGGWQGGDNLPYFRFSSEIPEVMDEFKKHYGDKPDTVRVYFLDDRVEDVFDTFTGMTGGGGRMLWRGDGEFMTGKLNTTTKKWTNLAGREVAQPEEYKEFGRMQCVVPELAKAGHRGIVRFNTTGRYDVRNISVELHDAFQKIGTLRQVPFILFRVEQYITQPDGKRRKDSLVHVALESDYEAKLVELMGQEDEDPEDARDFDPGDGLTPGEENAVAVTTPVRLPVGNDGTPTQAKAVLSAPADSTELWGKKRWQALGYDAREDAAKVIARYAKGEKDIAIIWHVLVEHAPKPPVEVAIPLSQDEQEILDEIRSDGGNPEEVPSYPDDPPPGFAEENDIPF